MKKYANAVTYGLFTSLALITYFLLLNGIGLAEYIELRFFNAIIIAFGIILAIKSKKAKPEFNYLNGLGAGIYSALFSVIPFAIFMFVFLTINTEFMNYLVVHAPFGSFLNPTASASVILFEGVSSGVVIAFTAMQYFKKSSTLKVV